VIRARVHQLPAKIMCRRINATTMINDASGTPALTASMIIEGRSDLNMRQRDTKATFGQAHIEGYC
jgi:hypothetical protein